MDFTYQSINVERSAHYITQGKLTKKTRHILFCLHGYGQTAEYLARKFDFLDEEEYFIICPEGLNKFYWHDGNEPVACWMTRRHRYEEINDFVGFLDKLYSRYCLHVNQETKVILFGFSQGCATIWRWLHASQPRFDVLINWSGWIPEDISYLHMKDYFKDTFLFFHYGTEDQFMTPKMIAMMDEVISSNGLDITVSKFKGKHHIPKTELQNFINKQLSLI